MSNKIKLYFIIDIHPTSIQRILFKFGYRSKMKPKMLLTAAKKKKRLQWTCHHQNWSIEVWKNVLWIDESKIELPHGNDQKHYRRQSFENPLLMVQPKVKIYFISDDVGMFNFNKIIPFATHLVKQQVGFRQKEWKWYNCLNRSNWEFMENRQKKSFNADK